jgi:fido (protein-threonine AMPylation protein)
MPNKYQYIDPEYLYTDPQTGILRNLAGATDHNMLTIVETGATTKRVNELQKNPIKIKKFHHFA